VQATFTTILNEIIDSVDTQVKLTGSFFITSYRSNAIQTLVVLYML